MWRNKPQSPWTLVKILNLVGETLDFQKTKNADSTRHQWGTFKWCYPTRTWIRCYDTSMRPPYFHYRLSYLRKATSTLRIEMTPEMIWFRTLAELCCLLWLIIKVIHLRKSPNSTESMEIRSQLCFKIDDHHKLYIIGIKWYESSPHLEKIAAKLQTATSSAICQCELVSFFDFSLNFPRGVIDEKTSLIEIMAWCPAGKNLWSKK